MEAPNKVLVAGGQGRLGRALGAVGGPRVVAVGRDVLDITDADTIARVLLAVQPAAVINAAVARGIELAEADPSDAQAINAVGPAKLAELCARASIPLIHISTDYVFGAETNRPWREDDPVSPVNVYGRTKADGERRVLAVHARACVVRVAWLFGDGEDFIARLLSAGATGIVAVAEDQIGSPTPIYLAAERLLDLAELMIAGNPNVPPILHVAGSPPASRADWVMHFFEAIRRGEGRTPSLRPASLASFPSIASRPHFSALDCSLATSLFGSPLDWRNILSPSWGRP
jgi:dTDP-4-dehydrorhamnose reductase